MTEEQLFHGLLMIKLPALCKWVNNDTLNYLQQTVIPAKLCTHAKRWANSWIIAVNSEFLGSQAVFCLATTKESRAEKIHFFPKLYYCSTIKIIKVPFPHVICVTSEPRFGNVSQSLSISRALVSLTLLIILIGAIFHDMKFSLVHIISLLAERGLQTLCGLHRIIPDFFFLFGSCVM